MSAGLHNASDIEASMQEKLISTQGETAFGLFLRG